MVRSLRDIASVTSPKIPFRSYLGRFRFATIVDNCLSTHVVALALYNHFMVTINQLKSTVIVDGIHSPAGFSGAKPDSLAARRACCSWALSVIKGFCFIHATV